MQLTLNAPASGYLQQHSGLVVLAPPDAIGVENFSQVEEDPLAHRNLFESMQRFRGRIALEEGAIHRDRLTSDGRHAMNIDRLAWHLVLLNHGTVAGAMRYVHYPNTISYGDLLVRQTWLAHTPEWGFDVQLAVESTLSEARQRQMHFGEPGGWVLSSDLRHGRDAIRLALGCFALAQRLGGAVGICSATHKNHSAKMLRRLGGERLGTATRPLPVFHEPQYDCDMELLRFDSSVVTPSYQGFVDELAWSLANSVPVLTDAVDPVSVTKTGLRNLSVAINRHQSVRQEQRVPAT